jgi:hypothetical protein
MLVILFDSAVILILAYAFNGGERPSWGTGILTAIAVSLGFLGCGFLLGESLGLFAFVPMVFIAGGLMTLTCDVPWKKGLIAGVILLVYKVGLSLLVSEMLG